MTEFKIKLDEMPELDEYIKIVSSLSDFDFRGKSQELIGRSIISRTQILPGNTIIFDPTNINSCKFFRVRRNINLCREDINTFKPFIYPDVEFCISNGRANLKGQSVFYCSDNAFCAIAESKPSGTEFIYLGVWTVQAFDPVKAVTFCNGVKIHSEGHVREMTIPVTVNDSVSFKGIDRREHIAFLFEYFSSCFINDRDPYYLTSWISSKYLFDDRKGISCLHYQSVLATIFCNYVFHTDFVDKCMTLTNVFKIQTRLSESRLLDYKVAEVGSHRDGKVQWRTPSADDIRAFQSYLNLDYFR